MKAMVNPTHQRRVVGRASTMALILSVTVVKVWPRPMMASGSTGWCLAMSVALPGEQLRGGVAHLGQLEGPRAGPQFAQQVVGQLRHLQPVDLRARVLLVPDRLVV